MNRKNEFETMIEELNQPAPGLETTLDRAYKKKRKRTTKMIVRPLGGLAACFVVFVLLVNFCVPVAYACSRIPGLRELAEAVTFSRSLSDAVDNEFVQPMELKQSSNGITAEIVYLIVDQKQVNVFYRLHSDEHPMLIAEPDVNNSEGGYLRCGLLNNTFDLQNGELGSFTIDFLEEDVPGSLICTLQVRSSIVSMENAPPDTQQFPDIEDRKEPEYLAEFEFLLEFDPLFTAAGKFYPVNQTVDVNGQKITVTEIEVYPSHLRVNVLESDDNTAWIQDLDFYIETDSGIRFDTGSGITATGSADNPNMTSYRCESTYFYDAEQLKLVITGAKFLEKDMERTYVNLVTGETGPLPEGVSFESAVREGEDWIVTFRGSDWHQGIPMYQLFGHLYFDAKGNEYEINMWSSNFGDLDENGNCTYFLDTFPLKDYPYDEVWLSPHFSCNWTSEEEILITIQ